MINGIRACITHLDEAMAKAFAPIKSVIASQQGQVEVHVQGRL